MIQISFVVLTLVMATFVYAWMSAIVSRTMRDMNSQMAFKRRTLLLLAGWLSYISILSLAGVFTTISLPPRIPLLLVLPCFIFMIWFFRSGRFRDIIAATPDSWVIYLQSFRIAVELLLVSLYLRGLLPRAATFEGYNYEIIIGISALAIGYFGATKKQLPAIVIKSWNFAGLTTLAIVVFIMLSHAYAPGIYSNPEPLSIEHFGAFPFTFLAGFLMPLAVFMHVFSLVKTGKRQ